MKRFILAVCLGFLCCGFSYGASPNGQYSAELESHIQRFLAPVANTRAFGQRYAEAVEMIPFILEFCEKYNVDPLRVAVLASEENSWYQRGWGEDGEVGPLQVMPKWFKQFNLQTLNGQVEAGIWWIGEGVKKCGENAKAFQYYRNGKCETPSPQARRRERLYENAVKRHRKGRVQQ